MVRPAPAGAVSLAGMCAPWYDARPEQRQGGPHRLRGRWCPSGWNAHIPNVTGPYRTRCPAGRRHSRPVPTPCCRRRVGAVARRRPGEVPHLRLGKTAAARAGRTARARCVRRHTGQACQHRRRRGARRRSRPTGQRPDRPPSRSRRLRHRDRRHSHRRSRATPAGPVDPHDLGDRDGTPELRGSCRSALLTLIAAPHSSLHPMQSTLHRMQGTLHAGLGRYQNTVGLVGCVRDRSGIRSRPRRDRSGIRSRPRRYRSSTLRKCDPWSQLALECRSVGASVMLAHAGRRRPDTDDGGGGRFTGA